MQRAANLVFLLVLGFSWNLQGFTIPPEGLDITQENVDMKEMFGTWYDIVVASKIPFLHNFSKNRAITILELLRGTTESKLIAVRTFQTDRGCQMMTGEYDITGPGSFHFNITEWDIDMDVSVFLTNYNEYAMMIMKSLKPSDEASIAFRLYSRTKTVRDNLVEAVVALAKHYGMGDEDIFIKEDKGDCVPGEQVNDSSAKRNKRTFGDAEFLAAN